MPSPRASSTMSGLLQSRRRSRRRGIPSCCRRTRRADGAAGARQAAAQLGRDRARRRERRRARPAAARAAGATSTQSGRSPVTMTRVAVPRPRRRRRRTGRAGPGGPRGDGTRTPRARGASPSTQAERLRVVGGGGIDVLDAPARHLDAARAAARPGSGARRAACPRRATSSGMPSSRGDGQGDAGVRQPSSGRPAPASGRRRPAVGAHDPAAARRGRAGEDLGARRRADDEDRAARHRRARAPAPPRRRVAPITSRVIEARVGDDADASTGSSASSQTAWSSGSTAMHSMTTAVGPQPARLAQHPELFADAGRRAAAHGPLAAVGQDQPRRGARWSWRRSGCPPRAARRR